MSRYSLDSIYLRNLQLSASVGFDAWGRTGKHQPLALSLRLYRDTSLAGGSDTIQDTLSYGQMCKDLTAKIDGHEFGSLDTLTGAIESLSNAWSGRKLSYTVTLPKGLLRADGGFGREIVLQRNSSGTWQFLSGLWFIKQIKTACIIGVNPHERLEKQGVSIDIYVPGNQLDLDKELCTSQSDQTWRNLVRMATDVSILWLFIQ